MPGDPLRLALVLALQYTKQTVFLGKCPTKTHKNNAMFNCPIFQYKCLCYSHLK